MRVTWITGKGIAAMRETYFVTLPKIATTSQVRRKHCINTVFTLNEELFNKKF